MTVGLILTVETEITVLLQMLFDSASWVDHYYYHQVALYEFHVYSQIHRLWHVLRRSRIFSEAQYIHHFILPSDKSLQQGMEAVISLFPDPPGLWQEIGHIGHACILSLAILISLSTSESFCLHLSLPVSNVCLKSLHHSQYRQVHQILHPSIWLKSKINLMTHFNFLPFYWMQPVEIWLWLWIWF